MLEDLLSPNLDLVICGTAAGRKSAELEEYYAGPGNKFWNILHEVGLTPQKLSSSKYKQLSDCSIGLTDIVKEQSGMDGEIDFRGATPEVLRQKIERLKPKVLCFNGKRGAQAYYGKKKVEFGLQSDKIGTTLVYIAPSTSGAANKTWDPGLWKELAKLVKRQLAS